MTTLFNPVMSITYSIMYTDCFNHNCKSSKAAVHYKSIHEMTVSFKHFLFLTVDTFAFKVKDKNTACLNKVVPLHFLDTT